MNKYQSVTLRWSWIRFISDQLPVSFTALKESSLLSFMQSFTVKLVSFFMTSTRLCSQTYWCNYIVQILFFVFTAKEELQTPC
jgi:hypothetical protein